MGLAFCLLAFVAALFFTWRSVLAGLAVVLTTGYLFGIVRANYPDTYSHFHFSIPPSSGSFCPISAPAGSNGPAIPNSKSSSAGRSSCSAGPR